MASTLSVQVEFEGGSTFAARNPRGGSMRLQCHPGPEETVDSLSPMEGVLASLAGCSGIDVAEILRKQRQPPKSLSIHLSGERADSVPAVFRRIEVAFRAEGVTPAALRRAVDLSLDKYCSVARMLQPGVEIRTTVEAVPSPAAEA